ncbi:hypothetical protein M5D96_004377, partial [Drosophila gunungcola]
MWPQLRALLCQSVDCALICLGLTHSRVVVGGRSTNWDNFHRHATSIGRSNGLCSLHPHLAANFERAYHVSQ